MELTKNVSIVYLSSGAREAKRLEKAVRAFPAKVDLVDLAESGDKPAVFVCMGRDEIVLRPHQCRVGGVSLPAGIKSQYDKQPVTTVKFGGETYCIMDIPIYS